MLREHTYMHRRITKMYECIHTREVYTYAMYECIHTHTHAGIRETMERKCRKNEELVNNMRDTERQLRGNLLQLQVLPPRHLVVHHLLYSTTTTTFLTVVAAQSSSCLRA